MGVYRDPFCSLKGTLRLVSQYPSVASNIRRIWFDGFHASETSAYIFEILHHCDNLRPVTLPWIALRHGTAKDWSHLLGSGSSFNGISSLELLAVDLKESQRSSPTNQVNNRPLHERSVNFSRLTRLKIFGDTNFMPVTDDDLRQMARTATNLQELHVTGMSSITIDGVMALVKSSRNTLRVLEYSPVSKDGFEHPEPTGVEGDEHLCSTLSSCPRLENLSISLPSICSDLFSNDTVKWKGEAQIRTSNLCKIRQDLAQSKDAQDDFWGLLDKARSLMTSRLAEGAELDIEIFICKDTSLSSYYHPTQ